MPEYPWLFSGSPDKPNERGTGAASPTFNGWARGWKVIRTTKTTSRSPVASAEAVKKKAATP